jgi:hypothetical protein
MDMKISERFFESNVRLDQDDPQVFSDVILAHTEANESNDLICGSWEKLGGWDKGKPIHLAYTPFWTPGSKLVSEKWHEIRDDGTWKTLAYKAV